MCYKCCNVDVFSIRSKFIGSWNLIKTLYEKWPVRMSVSRLMFLLLYDLVYLCRDNCLIWRKQSWTATWFPFPYICSCETLITKNTTVAQAWTSYYFYVFKLCFISWGFTLILFITITIVCLTMAWSLENFHIVFVYNFRNVAIGIGCFF